jgi:ectoine hydroxylase-related dioxygenase (phytanoyl-CoA dioxygenase family)
MLQNESYKKILDELGFVRLKIFKPETIFYLKEIYKREYDFRLGYLDSNVSHNKLNPTKALKISQEIENTILHELNDVFIDFGIFSAHFAVKYKNEDSFVLHQDWNIVEESRTKTIQLWIPLEASYPENGGMCFVPGSHQFMQNMRSGSLDITRVKIEEPIFPHLSFARLLVGDAVAFYNNTFHGSFRNCSEFDRISVVVNLKKHNDQAFYFHLNEDNKIEKYPLTTETLFQNIEYLEKGGKPLWSQPLQTFTYDQQSNSNFNIKDLVCKSVDFKRTNNLPINYEFKSLKILKDDNLELEINSNGFSIIEFLDDEQIRKLSLLFQKYFPESAHYEGSFSSMSHLSGEQRKLAHIEIQEIISPSLSRYFVDYISPISLLYSRRPDNKGKLHWHSDPSFILNEHLDPMYGIWCPLLDVNRINGCLRLIRFGHRLVPKLNVTEENQVWPLAEHRKLLDKYAVDFNLKAGQALIYDTRMIHSSDPNFSNKERNNIVMRVCHKDQKFVKYIPESPSMGSLIELNEDYFFKDDAKLHCLNNTNVFVKNIFNLFDLKMETDTLQKFFLTAVKT